MLLSPIAQYCIRKLLKQSIEKLDYLFIHNPKYSVLREERFDRMLNNLSLVPEFHSLKIQELELLISFYQQIERTPANETALIEVKRRILQIIGFQANAVLPAQLSFVVQESRIERFRFFHQNQVKEGMRYENALFAAVYQFELTYRLQAYQIAWVLSEAKVPLIVSLSPNQLVIWVSLQSPAYSVLIRQDAKLLKTILSLNSVLRKAKAIDGHRSFKSLSNDSTLRSQQLAKKMAMTLPKSANSRDY